jgi:hypothetical protein
MVHPVAGNVMPISQGDKIGHPLFTFFGSQGTPGMKNTTRRRINGTGYVSLEDSSMTPDFRIRNRDGREKSLGIRVYGIFK